MTDTSARAADAEPTVADLDATIRAALIDAELEYESPQEGSFLVKLPGTHKLATHCWLVVGDHAVLIEAFVMRRPDENREQVHAWLLQRNSRMYGVHWAIDSVGDIYLAGRLPLAAVSPEELDRILGSVLEYADGSFNHLIAMGFGSSIRREWKWRVKNNHPLANLEADRRRFQVIDDIVVIPKNHDFG